LRHLHQPSAAVSSGRGTASHGIPRHAIAAAGGTGPKEQRRGAQRGASGRLRWTATRA
jgi:hypothetical protein